MKNSNIEWTDHTFNPWEGCTKVSPGCAHCYAETRNKRFNGGTATNWGKGAPRRRTSEANWRNPIAWNRTKACAACGVAASLNCPVCPCGSEVFRRPRVFCASLADWLDDEVQIEWLADLLALIHDTPNLDWLLLTKRLDNWRAQMDKVIHHLHRQQEVSALSTWLCHWYDGEPPHNVWMGATAENQRRADERIPALLKIPALIHFLSCEPLLGPIDLSAAFSWWEYCGACNTTFDFVEGRQDLCPECGRANHMSAAQGTTIRDQFEVGEGRIHLKEGPPIDWVIAGGESGPGARPMHPAWARSLRDQCAAAGVAFHFKQWGEWVRDADIHTGAEPSQLVYLKPDSMDDFRRMYRVGKKRAGRLLDGVTHDEFPEAWQ